MNLLLLPTFPLKERDLETTNNRRIREKDKIAEKEWGQCQWVSRSSSNLIDFEIIIMMIVGLQFPFHYSNIRLFHGAFSKVGFSNMPFAFSLGLNISALVGIG